MKWALVNSENVIENIIVYNGTDPYQPGPGLTLQQVADDAQIGDTVVP